jgi:hypothetical protein
LSRVYLEQNRRTTAISFFQKATKGLIVLSPEIHCDHMAMGLPPVTSAVSVLSNFGDASATPTGSVSELFDVIDSGQLLWGIKMYLLLIIVVSIKILNRPCKMGWHLQARHRAPWSELTRGNYTNGAVMTGGLLAADVLTPR